MCGICGEVRLDGGQANLSRVQAMADAMAARGPDAAGSFAQDRVALGHRRLAIIDLSAAGQQPMVDPGLGLAIAFNGCIYNYRSLRDELVAAGYKFFSTSDTEVILKAFHAWGPRCVERFHGMFAFAVWERDSGRVTLARDRLGIKPLYIAEAPGLIAFASFLPAMLQFPGVDRSIDPVALHHYLTFHAVVPAPRTILRGVRKLPPATILTIDPDGRRREETYWTLTVAPSGDDLRRSFTDWQDLVLEALTTAVDRRLVADVPVGVLLSGGLDSSLIVGLLARLGQEGLSTFSVGFETVGGEQGDEFQYSDLVAQHFGTDHHRIVVPTDILLDTLPRCVAAMAEPQVSHDAIGFFLLSREVSKHVKVVQSGQGADEVFGGYHWYPPLLSSNDPLDDYSRVFFDRDHAETVDAVHPDLAEETDHSRAFVARRFAAAGAERPVDKALRLDTTVMLVDDPVKRVDNMTMAWGLEARVPFLDHELVELAGRIPAEHKVGGGGKHVLKEAARRVIPEGVIDRPKGYFPVPALKYLEGAPLAFVRDILYAPEARRRRLFQDSYLDRLFADPQAHITPLRGSKLWQVALLEHWLQVHGIAAE